MFFRKKSISIPTIEILKEYHKPVPAWNGEGIVFRIIDGEGVLQQAYGENGTSGLCSLMFGDIPLIRLHGDNYMCPTCEKLLSTGYGFDKTKSAVIDGLRSTLNDPAASLAESLVNITPLLGLLRSGIYALAEVELYPTDGDGHFFWSICNTPKLNQATCPVYEDGNWQWEYPAFVLPSQPPTLYNPEQAEYYRKHPECRAIAFNMGFLNVLLDGHHKAVAAALESRKLKTLVILSTTSLSFPHATNQYKTKLGIAGEWIDIDELGISQVESKSYLSARRLSDKETKKCLDIKDKNFDEYIWSKMLIDSAKHYPTAKVLAYIQWAGDLSDERLELIVERKECPDINQMWYICATLFYINHPQFCEIAFSAGKDERYACIWYDIFKLLSNIQSKAVEDFFIAYLVNDDGLRPEVTRIADEYLAVK